MKHAVSSKKKASPLPRKSYSESEEDIKKMAKAIVASSRKLNSAKPVSIKSELAVASNSARLKASVSKSKSVVKAVSPTVADEKKNKKSFSAAKLKTVAAKNNLEPTKKAAPKAIAKSAKVSVQKTKPIVVAKQKKVSKPAAAEPKPKTAETVEKPRTGKTASKISAAKTIAKISPVKAKTSKTQAAKSKTQTLKTKTVKPVEKIKTDGKKTSASSTKKIVAAEAKTKKTAKRADKKTSGAKTAAAKKVSPKTAPIKAPKNAKTIKPAKNIVVKTKPQPKPKAIKAKADNTPKTVKASAKKVEIRQTVKIKNGRLVLPPRKKIEAVEKPVEMPIETVEAVAPKPRRKKLKSFGSATFRGQKERYDFQVFPVDGEFEDAAAVFIISRRVVDRFERAHHRMVCIGQTASVLKELKKHRKGKCFKQHQVNAVSVLREEDEQKRQKIEADLKSAHRIPCPH